MYICVHMYLSDSFLTASGGPEFTPVFITPFLRVWFKSSPPLELLLLPLVQAAVLFVAITSHTRTFQSSGRSLPSLLPSVHLVNLAFFFSFPIFWTFLNLDFISVLCPTVEGINEGIVTCVLAQQWTSFLNYPLVNISWISKFHVP